MNQVTEAQIQILGGVGWHCLPHPELLRRLHTVYPVPPVKTAYSKFSPTDSISIEMDPLDLIIKINMKNYKI